MWNRNYRSKLFGLQITFLVRSASAKSKFGIKKFIFKKESPRPPSKFKKRFHLGDKMRRLGSFFRCSSASKGHSFALLNQPFHRALRSTTNSFICGKYTPLSPLNSLPPPNAALIWPEIYFRNKPFGEERFS